MNVHDQDKLIEAVNPDLPPGFAFERYDDFLNFRPPEQASADGVRSVQRVVRVVGPKRCLVLMVEDSDPYSRGIECYYLRNDREVVSFDTRKIEREWKQANGKNWYDPYNFDKVVGEWLEAHDAKTFTGRGWVKKMRFEIFDLVDHWNRLKAEQALDKMDQD